MFYIILIILQLIASLAIIAEILLPSLGLLSIIAASMYFYSYYYLYQNNPAMIPVLILLNLFTIPATLVFGIKKLPLLKDGIKKPSNCNVGDIGKAYTDIHPSGRGKFNGNLYEVLSTKECIKRDSIIKIVSQTKRFIKVTSVQKEEQ